MCKAVPFWHVFTNKSVKMCLTLLDDLVEDFEEEGATQTLVNSINVFLINWLVKHIKGINV